MARSFVASSSQYLSGDISSALPDEFYLSVLYYREVDTTQLIFSVCDSSGDNRVQIAQATTGRAQFNIINGGTTISVQSANNTLPTGQWHHVGVREWFDGTNRRVMYINGTPQVIVSGGTVTVPSGTTAVAGARISSGTPQAFLTGRIAWLCIRNAPLFSEDVAVEAATRNPFSIKPEIISHFWQLWGDGTEIDLVGGVALSPTNSPGKVDHPWITEQRPTLWLPYSAGEAPPTFTAAAALTQSSQSIAASATFAPGTKTATAALTQSSQQVSASAEFDAPVFTASSTITQSSQLISASVEFATVVFEATATLTQSSQAIAAEATFTELGAFQAAAALTQSSQEVAGAATFTPGTKTAAAAIEQSSQVIIASATFNAPVFAADVSVTQSSQEIAATATFATVAFAAAATITQSSQAISGIVLFTAPEVPDTDTAWVYWCWPILAHGQSYVAAGAAAGIEYRSPSSRMEYRAASTRICYRVPRTARI